MKRIFPFYLYPNFFKLIGLIISITGIILSFFVTPDFQLLFILGLILIVFSKEKQESDLTVFARAETFKTIIGLYFSFLFVLFLMEIIYNNIPIPCGPFLLIGIPLIFYIVYFNLLLLINLDKAENRKKRRINYFAWLAFAILSSIIYGFLLIE